MEEDGGLGRPRPARVMVDRDGVEELRSQLGGEAPGAFFDEPKAEMDVPQEGALDRGGEERAGAELSRSAGVVEKRRRDEQVATQAPVELARLTADRRHGDRVLEETARIAVMAVRCRGKSPKPFAEPGLAGEGGHQLAEPGVSELVGEEVEEAVQLVEVATCAGREGGGVDVCAFEGADVELEPVAEALDAGEDADGVALAKPGVQELDVAPHSPLDRPRPVGELDGEVRTAGAGAKPPLARDGEHAIDDPVLDERGDRDVPLRRLSRVGDGRTHRPECRRRDGRGGRGGRC